MAGLTAQTPQPTEITVHETSRVLEVGFSDGRAFRIPFELMRVYSPSAEVKGHAAGEGILVTDKESVGIAQIEPIGLYAVRIVFDDSHNTGLYTWSYLYEMCSERDRMWARYLERLAQAGKERHPEPKWAE